ncbi:MAG: hypothetical protein HYZ25_03585 [Chloroflexi bacterium]|nr:hypothetical protein [Chloroflexota bacterium]
MTAKTEKNFPRRNDHLLAGILSIILISLLDLLTNHVDVTRFQWDFRYYIAMAQDGLNTPLLASPFVYRYATPLLVRMLTGLGLSIEGGFTVIAYLGAFLQLTGIFAFTGWMTGSRKAAWIAMLVTGFSLFHVKFLLFDVFRPDHLAYAFILLATWLAAQRRFTPLLIVTLIASQFREFTIVPLIAYLFSFARTESARHKLYAQVGLSILGLVLALGLPRLILPIEADFQFISLTPDGILRGVLAPFIITRDINFVYTLLSYLMPLWIAASIPQIQSAYRALSLEWRHFLTVYTGLVLLLSFFGGTDFPRFTTFLFIPQIILLGGLAEKTHGLVLAFMLAATAFFNLVWLPIPMDSMEAYRDFYGGYNGQVTIVTFWRILEMLVFVLFGWILRKRLPAPQP